MNKREDFIGIEFDWFAADSDGFLALMSSAGYGPIPDLVFEKFDEQQRIETFLNALTGQSLNDNWDQMLLLLSKTGVFMYDWKHWHGPYLRLGRPSQQKKIADLGLPADLQQPLPLFPVRFSDSAELRPEVSFPCSG